jgi:hypothetical protein
MKKLGIISFSITITLAGNAQSRNKIPINNSNTYIPTQKQILDTNSKKIAQLDLVKAKDTTNKTQLKAKMDAERWKCTQPDPKMIAAKKAAEEKFKKIKL